MSLFHSFHSGAARTMTLDKSGATGGDLKPPEGKCKLHPGRAVSQPQEEMTTVSQLGLNEDTNFLQLRDGPSALTSRCRTAREESNIPYVSSPSLECFHRQEGRAEEDNPGV